MFHTVYCGYDCLEKHLTEHKFLCDALKSRYSTTVEFASLPLPLRHVKHVTFGPPFNGPRPEMNSRRAFIVKVETNSLNCDPKQPLAFSDPSRTVNCLAESPEVFTVIIECGVLGNLSHFRGKKAFFGQLWCGWKEIGHLT